jgi:peptidylglycine monooxygenase
VTCEEQIVILGQHRYRVETPWGRLPAGTSLGLVSQVAADSSGRVYLLQRAFPSVLVFSPSGQLEAMWEHVRIMDGHGIYVSPDDRVFVVDRDAHQILILDTVGQILQTLGIRNRPAPGQPFNHPTDVAVAPDGDIYVSDGYGNSSVHRFTAEGRLQMSWGTPGAAPGEFTTPHAVWIDAENRVLIADRENNRVQVFDREGTYLTEWRDLYHPMDICSYADGSILVTDQVPRLSLFSLDGRLTGRCRPALNGAHGVCADRQGNIFLAEMIPSRITKLTLLQHGGSDA